jgi:hypothetical protein
MRQKPRNVTLIPRIDVRSARFMPAERDADELDDPETFALLSAFRHAHGTLRGPTTFLHSRLAADIDGSFTGVRAS